ncbi:MAG: class I SAM-dependent methyltransferase [Rhodobacteraceae bacterium]|nr:class I SAM-dependent methyltransferase [Paracoccaceae bacterium]
MYPASQSAAVLDFSDHEYLNDGPLKKHVSYLQRHHSFLYDMLKHKVAQGNDMEGYVTQMNRDSWEFEESDGGGRGAEYNIAQQNIDNRMVGIASLLRLFGRGQVEIPNANTVIVDALAGDGTISRLVKQWDQGGPTIICADLSRYMIERCVEQGLPCIRQSATHSLLDDNVADGVLIAYGSHHLSTADRLTACREAYRTLKPGRRFVLHDFRTGGPVDDWFAQVVHPYSLTGHPHPHFSEYEIQGLIDGAGFTSSRVFEMDDPFIVTASSSTNVRAKMLRHLHAMYGLVRIPLVTAGDQDLLEEMVRRTLGKIVIERSGQEFTATLSRRALVAVGTK